MICYGTEYAVKNIHLVHHVTTGTKSFSTILFLFASLFGLHTSQAAYPFSFLSIKCGSPFSLSSGGKLHGLHFLSFVIMHNIQNTHTMQ
jgi:hypothetical protein